MSNEAEQVAQRQAKLKEIERLGVRAYPHEFDRTASLSALNPSLPAPDQDGGASSPACTSLLPAAVVPRIVAVLAQMTLAHARTAPPAEQEARAP